VAITLTGIPAAFSLDVLDVMDKIAGNVFLVAGGLMLAVFVGWVMPDPEAEIRKGARGAAWLPLWRNFLRFVVPPVLAFVLFITVRDTWATIAGLLG